MNINGLYEAVSPHFRRRRMRRFLEEIAPCAETTILDVGGCPPTWEEIPGLHGRITILNLASQAVAVKTPRYEVVLGDGTDLPYPDRSFDVVFSNSVIEHVGDFEKQQAFAREASRVGRALWIQTPARAFFIEPHLIAPFIHWLPGRWQKALARHFTIRGWMTKPTPAQVEDLLAATRLLTYRDMRRLFPDCEIFVEHFCGMPKSYTAFRRPPPAAVARV